MVSNNENISILTRMDRHITMKRETNKMLLERIKRLISGSRRPLETTPNPSSFLLLRILNFETNPYSECQVIDFLSRKSHMFTNGATPNTGGVAS